MKIGIFGGSFNPVHKMHIEVAKHLINNKYLDKIIIVPVASNYKLKEVIDYKYRLNMLKIATKKYDNILVSDYEKKESKYTYQVLDYFKRVYKDDVLYFICGVDNILKFSEWKSHDYILDNYKILVVNRDEEFKKITNLPEYRNVYYVDFFKNDFSSTLIRRNIKNTTMLNKNVYKYIIKNNLYGVNHEKDK